MVEIRVDTIVHPNVSVVRSMYRVIVDGVLFCTTDDDIEGFQLMIAKEVMEARCELNQRA